MATALSDPEHHLHRSCSNRDSSNIDDVSLSQANIRIVIGLFAAEAVIYLIFIG